MRNLIVVLALLVSTIGAAAPRGPLERVVAKGLNQLSGNKGRRWKVAVYARGEFHPGFYATSRGVEVAGTVTPTARGRYGQKLSVTDRLFIPTRPAPVSREGGTVGRMSRMAADGWSLKRSE